ncbi:MAG: type II secretion system protein GspG [Phycisphaeraceae bacterium]|nr:MAG: type II secretion system protein GspG [Phycisphaeraceae bacterium]
MSRGAQLRRGGFSLLELLVALIILGLLVTLVAPRLLDNIGQGRVTTTRTQIANLSSAVSQFYLDVGRYPTEEEGLEALLRAPQGPEAEKWSGPYLETNYVPQDAWGREFHYILEPDGRYLIRSLGADGRPGGEGDNAELDNRN